MSWKEILKEDLESKILSEIEKEGGALGMKNLKQFGEKQETICQRSKNKPSPLYVKKEK